MEINRKFKGDTFLSSKINQLKKINQKNFKSNFDSIIKIISHFNLKTDQEYEIKNFLRKNIKLIKKFSSFKKINVLILSNHFMSFFKNDFILHGINRNLIIDADFGELDNYNIQSIFKKKKIKKDYYDIILVSILPNYYDDINNSKDIYLTLVKSIKKICNSNIILTNVPTLSSNMFNINTINDINNNIFDLSKKLNFYIWDISKLFQRYGENEIHDNEYFFDNKMFFNPKNSNIIIDNFCSIASKIFYTSPRAVVTDLDNTFWKGVIGDDGIEKIDFSVGNSLTESFSIYQKFLKKISNHGIFIAISSKNDFDYINKAFKKRKFQIQFKEFSSTKINWDKKSTNIKKIINELNISPEQVLFIDDNDSERFEVLKSIKSINVINFDDINDLIMNLSDGNFFDTNKHTAINRTKSINIQKKFLYQKEKFGDYENFLKNLNMKCSEKKFDNVARYRLSEMTYKTNQFNFTFEKYNLEDIKRIINNKNLAFYYNLKDRFVDHGIVASINIKILKNNEAAIDSFVMSCRVFDKYLENFIFNSIKKKLLHLKIKKLTTFFIRTDRNKRFYNFYENYNFIKFKKEKNKIFYKILVENIKESKTYIN
tara:strand:+ start:312 stop:2111 length:1800 start_codon:yes stop_codon:yes gene_type:complete